MANGDVGSGLVDVFILEEKLVFVACTYWLFKKRQHLSQTKRTGKISPGSHPSLDLQGGPSSWPVPVTFIPSLASHNNPGQTLGDLYTGQQG